MFIQIYNIIIIGTDLISGLKTKYTDHSKYFGSSSVLPVNFLQCQNLKSYLYIFHNQVTYVCHTCNSGSYVTQMLFCKSTDDICMYVIYT